MGYNNIESSSTTDLSAVTSTGAGSGVKCEVARVVHVVVNASSVTTGGTVKVQGSDDGSNWFDLATISVGANGLQEAVIEFPPRQVRTNLTARTDGTYTTTLARRGNL